MCEGLWFVGDRSAGDLGCLCFCVGAIWGDSGSAMLRAGVCHEPDAGEARTGPAFVVPTLPNSGAGWSARLGDWDRKYKDLGIAPA